MLEIRSHEIRLVVSAVSVGIIMGSGLCYILVQQLQHRKQADSNKPKRIQNEYPSEIKSELSSRVRTFFGDKGFMKLESSYVVVRSYTYVIFGLSLHFTFRMSETKNR